MFLSQRVHVLSLLQNKFGLVFFRLFDSALETSNFRLEEARSAITLLRCFLHENTQRGKIARVKFAAELGTMSKNRLRWITLVRGPIRGIHSLTLMISCLMVNAIDLRFNQASYRVYEKMESFLVKCLNCQDYSTELRYLETNYKDDVNVVDEGRRIHLFR